MSSPRQMLVYAVDYMAWADAELLRSCEQLSQGELQQNAGISHSSIAGTLRHMFVAERIWLLRLRASISPPLETGEDESLSSEPAPVSDLVTIIERWPAVWEGLRYFVENLSEAEFDREFTAMGASIPRWKLILHVVNHATVHRGQVVGMLRQLGKQPPSTDLFTFHRLVP